MRLLFLFIFLIFSQDLFALAIGIGRGGITPHFNGSKRDYCNQWNDTGIITNETNYVTVAAGKWMFTYLHGVDSICSEIKGFFITKGFNFSERMDLGVVFGGYDYIQENWDNHAANAPTNVDAPTPVTIVLFGERFVPVFGLSINFHLIKSERWSLISSNMITPVIFNHSLMLQYRFK